MSLPATFHKGLDVTESIACEMLIALAALIGWGVNGIPVVMLAAETSPTLWTTSEFRVFCLMGSLAGAFLKIVVWPAGPETQITSRRMAAEFLASAICGATATPMVFHYLGWRLNVDSVLAVSAATAFVGVATLSTASELYTRFIKKRGEEIIGGDK